MTRTAQHWRAHLEGEPPDVIAREVPSLLADMEELEQRLDYWKDLALQCEANHTAEH